MCKLLDHTVRYSHPHIYDSFELFSIICGSVWHRSGLGRLQQTVAASVDSLNLGSSSSSSSSTVIGDDEDCSKNIPSEACSFAVVSDRAMDVSHTVPSHTVPREASPLRQKHG